VTKLSLAAAGFAVAVVLHNGDHLRRGADAVDADVFWAGTAAIVVEVGIVFLVCQRHRWAPTMAAVVGFGLALGYVVVHFSPQRAWLSDSLVGGGGGDGWSLAAASVEVAAALALAVAGLAARRQPPAARQRPARDAVRDPLAAGFALSQVMVLAVSFAQV
jgi:hypothetical protein